MSQPRMRKASVMVAGNGNRPHVAINKASGDRGPYAPAPKQLPEKRNRNKIPKTIRYDLENALVGLCDVWFEEIKPHLVRNNIKLHVHGAGVAGAAGPAGGDHQRLPPGAPGCSHLDPGAAPDHSLLPGANCAGCCLMPPTASRAQSLRPPARLTRSRSRQLLPSPPFPLSPPLINQNLNTKGERKRTHRFRRNIRSPKSPSAQSTLRVPRICRTYCALPSPTTPKTLLRRIQPAHPQQRRESFVEKKNRSTQTEMFSSRIRCSVQQKRVPPTPFGRCAATTTFFPLKCEKNIISPKNAVDQPKFSKPPLFYKDFINIVGERHDKRLKLLYRSPTREECPSILNLVQSSKDTPIEAYSRKKRPWR
ncbi:hypothetical protein O3G_MSEX011002 [Manduca sexta]|uniref:Uncharacterized protein n=1 Tax=Manduca sexta TaxID=7130 RepID=A0A922CUR9_MANSE|nr:hypothetical protein O3G_MSEX011002 [Manduca sexta]